MTVHFVAIIFFIVAYVSIVFFSPHIHSHHRPHGCPRRFTDYSARWDPHKCTDLLTYNVAHRSAFEVSDCESNDHSVCEALCRADCSADLCSLCGSGCYSHRLSHGSADYGADEISVGYTNCCADIHSNNSANHSAHESAHH